MRRLISVIVSVALLSSCSAPSTRSGAEDAQDFIIIDTHIDVPYRLERNAQDVSQATDGGDFDYPRAVAGGVDAAFMSIYIPAAVDEADEGMALANKMIDGVEKLVANNPDKFALATCPSDVITAAADGLIALPMGMENGGPIRGDRERLQHLFDRGIRYITLAHSKSNSLSDSSYDENRQWGGLSEAGRATVRDMNRLGIMVDVSHLSDDAFWHVLSESSVPVIASHSSMRHFTPGWERNMSDEMVQALGEAGGVIQINFGSSFLTQIARAYGTRAAAAAAAFIASQHVARDHPSVVTFRDQYLADNPYPFANIDDVLDHIDRAVLIAGIDGVGVGSDYDGVGDSLPVGLKDVSTYPNLIDGLRGRGYSTKAIRNILGDNLLRVWREVYRKSIEHGTNPDCRA